MITIIVTGFEAATATDVLQGTRLQTVPSNGILLVEMQAADNVAANSYASALQLPSGKTPFTGMLVPGGRTAGLAGGLDSDMAFRASFTIRQGGHAVLDFTETGDTEVFWRITFKGIELPGG